MHIKNEIVNFLSEHGIRLNDEFNDQIVEDIKRRTGGGENIFDILYSLPQREDIVKNNLNKKAPSFKRGDKKKSVIMIDGGKEKEFDSVYSAAKHIGLDNNCIGNITKACNGQLKTAYKKKWKWKI